MIGTADLERRVKEKLATSDQRLRLRQDHMRTLMREAEERQAFYTVTADRLMEEVIRPRVATLKASLDTIATCAVETGRHSCCLGFAHTVRFPATARLELGVTRDSDTQNLIVQFCASILPIFFPYDGVAELAFPLHQVDAERAAAWADDRLVEFVGAYLRLETDHRYQDDNRVTDPVCGMSVNRAEAPAHAEYDGKTYYFLCRSAETVLWRSPSATSLARPIRTNSQLARRAPLGSEPRFRPLPIEKLCRFRAPDVPSRHTHLVVASYRGDQFKKNPQS